MSKEKFVLTLDSTQITAFETCPMYWHLGQDLRLDPIGAEAKTAISIGTYGHKLMERYYTARGLGQDILQAQNYAFEYDFDNSICRCGHGIEAHLIDEENKPSVCRHQGCGCLAFTKTEFPLEAPLRKDVINRFLEYLATYSWTDIEVTDPSHVEVGFSTPIYEDDERLYVLEGRIDLMGIMGGTTEVFLDHKWQMRKRDLYTRSIQFKNYALATQRYMGVINYVRMAKKVDENTFRRDIIALSRDQIHAWHRELIGIYQRAELAIRDNSWDARPMYKRRSSCPGMFGYECQFTGLCDESNDWVRAQKQQTLYQVRPEWRPW